MRKNKTIQIRINAKTKAKLEKVFKRLGIKMSEAIRTYFEKVLIWDKIQEKTAIRKPKSPRHKKVPHYLKWRNPKFIPPIESH